MSFLVPTKSSCGRSWDREPCGTGILPVIHQCSCHHRIAGAKTMNGNALGLIETLGLVGLIYCG